MDKEMEICTLTYQCNEGYELVGRANRYCQSNGQWSGVLPSCRRKYITYKQDDDKLNYKLTKNRLD
ncbi:hypothetical protein B4U80_04838 [Leptotrombidium deliense]|uniref:Sushi domain-containing protein n=1 Tax=Leptotrombidium deliense TaxID=299467 RepID=A0A443SWT7_9ACAR|nr:hypothetical protein B4U80_04838 [Leptotrombidium deliense]